MKPPGVWLAVETDSVVLRYFSFLSWLPALLETSPMSWTLLKASERHSTWQMPPGASWTRTPRRPRPTGAPWAGLHAAGGGDRGPSCSAPEAAAGRAPGISASQVPSLAAHSTGARERRSAKADGNTQGGEPDRSHREADDRAHFTRLRLSTYFRCDQPRIGRYKC